MMSTLYIWFPASWAPSVVEAMVQRNRTWLATTPVHRDPAVFNANEREEGHASRDMSYKIQKWNVDSTDVFPILLANTRVDWLGLEDTEITQHFQVLREGILRDVFSQRASSAWQGAQPQKVTVSLLLPGSGTADHWLAFLQSQRHFWPSMTTRHASLVPIDTHTFQREASWEGPFGLLAPTGHEERTRGVLALSPTNMPESSTVVSQTQAHITGAN